jgi:hypothetical protein
LQSNLISLFFVIQKLVQFTATDDRLLQFWTLLSWGRFYICEIFRRLSRNSFNIERNNRYYGLLL